MEYAVTRKMYYDVVVIGAGCAGISAAVAAARYCNNVLLVEKNGWLGGISTTILDTMNGFYLPGADDKKVVRGIGDEIIERLMASGQAFYRGNTYGSGKVVTYSPIVLQNIYLQLLEEHHVHILFHSTVCDAEAEDGRIKRITARTKKESIEIQAGVFIDCSGDGDVFYHAGFEYDGVNGSEHVQSLTTTFRMINVDESKLKTFTKEQMWSWMKEAALSGEFNLPRWEGSYHRTTIPGCVQTNMVRVVKADPTDVTQLSEAEIEGVKQAVEYAAFMKKYLPGFEHSNLLSSSVTIGVRETRRVIGEYILTEQDVRQAASFEDSIGLCGAPVEDHNQGSDTRWEYLKENRAYGIPYRTLIPKGSKNLLAAGRCFSATHTAHASCRSIAQCMAMGQAAGTAAALAVQKQCSVSSVPYSQLREKLLEQNVQLSMEG